MSSVIHPEHYKTGKYECIEVMQEIFGEKETAIFCKLNAFKYLWRCNHKNDETEDIQKAKTYLQIYEEITEGMDAEG